MEQSVKMAIYEMALVQPALAKIAQTFLEEQNLATVEDIKVAVANGTLVESADIENMSIIKMIDVLISAEQYAQFS